MGMIRHADIERILNLSPSGHPVLSLYLNAHLGLRTLDAQRITIKSMIRDRKREIEARQDLDPRWRDGALRDLERLEDRALAMVDVPHGYRGLVMFFSSGEGLELAFHLPQPVRDALIVDHTPYVRPLLAILDEYHRVCTLLLDRERAELYEVYMGEILHHQQIFDEVPGRVRIAGWYGLEERRIERHVEDHVHRHFRHVSEVLFRAFRQLGFDWLVLGGHHEVIADFRPYLHPYLEPRLIGEFHAEPGETPLATVLNRTREVEQAAEREEQRRLVRELVEQAQGGRLGVLGLEKTLSAVQRAQVRILLVEEGFAAPGVFCSRCGFLGLEERACPICGASTAAAVDIVDEALEATVHYGGHVRHITPGSELSASGRIGALLRYPLPEGEVRAQTGSTASAARAS
ncbi:MAG: hypothetical protein ONB23_09750 [candidate division KSB1 bacterium]|nr:hypothetical protein [candidate division KSB1 bacterium]